MVSDVGSNLLEICCWIRSRFSFSFYSSAYKTLKGLSSTTFGGREFWPLGWLLFCYFIGGELLAELFSGLEKTSDAFLRVLKHWCVPPELSFLAWITFTLFLSLDDLFELWTPFAVIPAISPRLTPYSSCTFRAPSTTPLLEPIEPLKWCTGWISVLRIL